MIEIEHQIDHRVGLDRRRAVLSFLLPTLALDDALRVVAARVIWFEDAEEAVTDVARFVAYAMTYGTYREMMVLRTRLSDDDLRVAMILAPPGVFDARSWAYWHVRLGAFDVPPLPEKHVPDFVVGN